MASKKKSSQEMEGTEQMDEKATFFSKLRHLAVQIDESSVIQQELNSRKLKQYEHHTNAIMFLHQTKRELSTILQISQAKKKDFSSTANSFGKMQELITNILSVQKIRYDQVESFMAPYGFSKPEQKTSSGVDSELITETNELENKVSESDDKQDDGENSSFTVAQQANLNTGTPQHAHAKSVETSLMRTPQLEDLYGQLSEHTIFLMKDEFNNIGQGKFGASLETSDNTSLTCILEPDGHAPLKCDYRNQATEKSMFLELGNASSPQLVSRTEKDATLTWGETPVLCTPGFSRSHFKLKEVDREVLKCAKSSLYTPPVPDLLTCVLSTPECPVEPRSNKENQPVSRPSGLIATPEQPKLLSSWWQ